MSWHARLQLDYALEAARTVIRHQHSGPLRILQSLYPEGDAVCHNVLVHPPGGLVGGDTLDISVSVAHGAHGLITTPGATRFYRSTGDLALQRTSISMAESARLEWLPLETIGYNGCLAENRLTLQLAPGAEMLGWDVTAFGLPGAGLPFETGRLLQHIEMPGVWLERGCIDAADRLLLDGAIGMAGHRCMASLFLACGSSLDRSRCDAALEAARSIIQSHSLAATAGVTSPNSQIIVVRALAPVVEPAMDLMQRVRAAWRMVLWQLPATAPRIWAL